MSKFNIRSTYKTAVAAPLILALLARVAFANGLLSHDHSDHGVHSHAVTLDDLREGDLRASWHRYHDDERDDRNNDSEGEEYADPLFIFVNDPATALGIHYSSGVVTASIQHASSNVFPRSMQMSDPTDTHRFSAAPWPSAHALRPACALDALLQSSHALLL
jgi:hypothetical protein